MDFMTHSFCFIIAIYGTIIIRDVYPYMSRRDNVSNNNYVLEGTVKLIDEMQTFGSGFTKREFVITTEENYPQEVKFEFVKERCALLDEVKAGDSVRVNFRIRGNEYKERYYVNLAAYQLEKIGEDGGSVTVEPESDPVYDAPVLDDVELDDDMPF